MGIGWTRIMGLLVSAVVAVLVPARSHSNGVLGVSQERGSGIVVTPDGERVLVNKDVDSQRWTITRNLDDLTVTGNVFFPEGGDPLFVFCEQEGQSGDDLALACFGADACSESACPEFEFISDVVLPESFFEPPVAIAAVAARIVDAVASTSTGSARLGGVQGGGGARGSGIQITPDDRRVLISKDVGDQRWSITRNLDDLTVTGNVFFPEGGDPLFVFCEQEGQSGDDVTLACFGADRCTETACPEFEFIANVTLPESFFTPPSGPVGGLSTIQGRVRDVVEGAAGAQDGTATPSQVSGIAVEVRQGAETLDVTTTDAEGRFFLEFEGGGDVELTFAVGDVVVTLALSMLPGSVVTLEVEIRVDEDRVIVVDEPEVASPPIRCETGSLQIFDEELDLIVDGRGEDCLRAGGNCQVDLVVRSLTLVGCERCISAQGNSFVSITGVSGFVTCEAEEDGIRGQGTSSVLVDGLSGVEISATGENGIRAAGNSTVALVSDGTCHIGGQDQAIRIDGNATVDTQGCAALDLGAGALRD